MAAIGALLTSVLLMDLRILGLFAAVAREPFVRLMREVATGAFSVALLTGVPMFAIRAQQYATNSAFLAKMALLTVAGLNLLAFRIASRGLGGEQDYPAQVKTFCVISIALWSSILVAGRFVGFI